MRTEQKESIKKHVLRTIDYMGGQRATATRAGVSAATISQIVNDNWDRIADDMWRKVAAALGYAEEGWKLVDNTFNYRVLETTFLDAKNHSMMVGVSYKAGSGKTAGARLFMERYGERNAYYIHCREWSVKQFLKQLCRVLGIPSPTGRVTADDLMEKVVDFFLIRADRKPLLIVDEADKLQRSALRQFIPLFNATEDRIGIVLIGTENLKEEIKRGVRFNKKGYDEIDSRLGRRYQRLYGANKEDVKRICAANGITNKRTQEQIWKECNPTEVPVGNNFMQVIDDLRRLKKVIQRETINLKEAATA
jgi:plasmid maintenance system antidote protein VapI